MASYTTPGVYVEEIPKFPPSVAQVETAIPAFVGYTEKGPATPTRLLSMLEFETIFGTTPVESFTFDAVQDDAGLRVSLVTPPAFNYRLYYAMQHFFANGGGPCYVVSAGRYADGAVSDAALSAGLDRAADVDEITLLAVPDAALVAGDSARYAALMNRMLTQCRTKGDRFALLDVPDRYTSDQAITDNFRGPVRGEVEFAKYGAAYYPYLETTLSYRYADLGGKTAIRLRNFTKTTTDAAAATKATAAKTAADDLAAKRTDATAKRFAFNAASSAETTALRIKEVIDAQFDSSTVEVLKAAAGAIVGGVDNLATALKNAANKTALRTAANQQATDAGAAKTTAQTELTAAETAQETSQTALSAPLKAALDAGGFAFGASAVEADNPAIKISYTALYNALLRLAADQRVVLPPSGAVAGVYAQTDATRGVWKAPANVSLTQVVRPTVAVTDELQGHLNVSDTGKSVNAIRAFTGKGILVWGARTWAGSDNEWRYVPVRRLFNMVEESVKKATSPFVFEPNDANTWTRLRAMIENYLFNLWRQGALAGIKPEHAYYVHCGLGVTMTAQDILEGNLVVEIGMAAVRPAEFIVLKFSHKVQES